MNHPEVKTFVHLDDAAYSCRQSKNMLSRLDVNIYRGKRDSQQEMEYSIASLIPFVKSPDCMVPGSSTVKSFYSEIIKPLKELMSREELKGFYKLYENIKTGVKVHLEDRFPINFDYKIADSWSSFPEIYKTGVVSQSLLNGRDPTSTEEKEIPFIEHIISPYKITACASHDDKEFCIKYS